MPRSIHTAEYAALCRQLRSIRESAGLSQRELADRLNVPHSTVAKIESGEWRIDVVEFRWFISACDADPGDVLADLWRGRTKSSPRAARKRGGA